MKTLIQAAVVTLFASSAAQAQQAVQWRAEDGGNGHWYRHVSHGLNWASARAAAEASGGHLATTANATENAFMASLVTSHEAWIGGFQIPGVCEPGCDWQWVTGEPWDFVGWAAGEPNDWGDEDGVMLWPSGLWNDGMTWVGATYLIEWSADCNGDGIVDFGQCRDGTLPDYNGNNIPDCCERGEPCVPGHYPVQWKVSDGGNGHWYTRVAQPGGGPFDTIRRMAVARGGDLASIASAEEDDLARVVASPFAWNFGSLIGTRTPPGCADFVWSDGTPWGFTRWGAGQPNCKVGDGVGYYPDGWHDLYDFDVASFVVEWSADCNADGIVDYGQILNGQFDDFNRNGIPDRVCECIGDLDADGAVAGADLGLVLAAWGSAVPGTAADLNADGAVDGFDLAVLLAGWGPCTN